MSSLSIRSVAGAVKVLRIAHDRAGNTAQSCYSYGSRRMTTSKGSPSKSPRDLRIRIQRRNGFDPDDRHRRNNPTNRIVRNSDLAPTEMGDGHEFRLTAPKKSRNWERDGSGGSKARQTRKTFRRQPGSRTDRAARWPRQPLRQTQRQICTQSTNRSREEVARQRCGGGTWSKRTV